MDREVSFLSDLNRTFTPIQEPALPGAQQISVNDRVYTTNQDSNTVSVINPKIGRVLGTIPLGSVRMDTNANILGAMYNGEIGVHGLGFSPDGEYLNVVSGTTNSVHIIDTATNKILHTIYLGRGLHEGSFSPDGNYVWVAERGQDTIAIVEWRENWVVERIVSEDGPSKVVFSPDGRLAYVNHMRADVLDVIDVATRQVIERIMIPASSGGSSDLAVSPDGKEIWLGMPMDGKTITVICKGRAYMIPVLGCCKCLLKEKLKHE